ncbi:MinD/ParA family protein [Natronoarchaeum sp. GCM10025703]|uniref:MinD/ParA family ATP-binding protein n=1 Tax=Natronoarchaeum sp. GCM10025703 TaxID=3252685 RepID=UPI00361F59C8
MPDLHSLARVAPSLSATTGSVTAPNPATQIDKRGVTVLEAPTERDHPRPRPTFERIGRTLRDATARTLIDCSAGAGRDAAVPIDVATGVVLVSTGEPASLRDTAKTAAMAREVGTPILGAVLTRTDSVPKGTASLLGTERIVAVPDARRPLDSPAVRRVYDRLPALLDSQRDNPVRQVP